MGDEVRTFATGAVRSKDADATRYDLNAGHLCGPNCTPPPPTPKETASDKRVRVYLSGPMTGMDDWNFPEFNQAADILRQMGYTVSNPAEYGAAPAFSWAACLRRDIRDLLDCEVLVQLPGWENSRGANLEWDIARRLGMDVVSFADLAAKGA